MCSKKPWRVSCNSVQLGAAKRTKGRDGRNQAFHAVLSSCSFSASVFLFRVRPDRSAVSWLFLPLQTFCQIPASLSCLGFFIKGSPPTTNRLSGSLPLVLRASWLCRSRSWYSLFFPGHSSNDDNRHPSIARPSSLGLPTFHRLENGNVECRACPHNFEVKRKLRRQSHTPYGVQLFNLRSTPYYVFGSDRKATHRNTSFGWRRRETVQWRGVVSFVSAKTRSANSLLMRTCWQRGRLRPVSCFCVPIFVFRTQIFCFRQPF